MLPYIILTFSLFWAIAQCDIYLYQTNETFRDRLAGFGPNLMQDPSMGDTKGLDGHLLSVHSLSSSDRHGCRPIPHLLLPYLEQRSRYPCLVVMVQRGQCSFIDKVRAMQASGACAVIVGDNIPETRLITMSATGNTSDVTIPSVFISQWDYNILNYRSSNIHHPHTTPEPLHVHLYPTPEESVSAIAFLLLFILLPVGIVFFVSTTWYWITNEHRRTLGEAGEHGTLDPYQQRLQEEAMFPATLEMVQNLPTIQYDPEVVPLNHDDLHLMTCGICLDDFEKNEILRVLPCRHMFHFVCVDPWLLGRRRTCPMCKNNIASDPLPAPAPEPSGEQSSMVAIYDSQHSPEQGSIRLDSLSPLSFHSARSSAPLYSSDQTSTASLV
jgi:hypothetical protein